MIGSAQPRSTLFAPSVPVPAVDVHAGDTNAMLNDAPVPAGGDWTGVPEAFIDRTGAGLGSAGHQPHPNSVNPGGGAA